MSGSIITMMMHLFKRLLIDVLVFYSKNIYIFYVCWAAEKALHWSLSWELFKVTVRRKICEGRRGRRKTQAKMKGFPRKFFLQVKCLLRKQMKKKCFSWGTVKSKHDIMLFSTSSHSFTFSLKMCDHVCDSVWQLTAFFNPPKNWIEEKKSVFMYWAFPFKLTWLYEHVSYRE